MDGDYPYGIPRYELNGLLPEGNSTNLQQENANHFDEVENQNENV